MKVLEQAEVMRNQVAHHLERARIAARLTVIATVTDVAPVIEALRRTMEKIHRDRDVAIDVDAGTAAKFRGERQDLEEMVGNLVDNACKWARSRVFIETSVHPAAGAGPVMLHIIVDDDGQGLSDAERMHGMGGRDLGPGARIEQDLQRPLHDRPPARPARASRAVALPSSVVIDLTTGRRRPSVRACRSTPTRATWTSC